MCDSTRTRTRHSFTPHCVVVVSCNISTHSRKLLSLFGSAFNSSHDPVPLSLLPALPVSCSPSHPPSLGVYVCISGIQGGATSGAVDGIGQVCLVNIESRSILAYNNMRPRWHVLMPASPPLYIDATPSTPLYIDSNFESTICCMRGEVRGISFLCVVCVVSTYPTLLPPRHTPTL